MKILLFKHHDLLSFAIKAITRGQYVHAAILTDEDRLEIHEAFYPYVRSRLLANDELADFDVFTIRGFSPEMEARALAWMKEQVRLHTSYSITDLFRFLPQVRAVIGEPSAEAAQHSMFCSMFAFQAIHTGGIQLLNANSYDVAPSQLAWSPYLEPAAALEPTHGRRAA